MSALDGFSASFPMNENPNPNPTKRKRNLPGTPDPDAEVISLSPKSLMATNRFICEVCNKGFQRDQNLQLHRRGHNLPWRLRQRTNKEVRKKVYVCPEKNCVHHEPSRALGDLTGIKKHFSRKHGEKKWKCEKCSKKYAVQSDWKAHSKICGTKEYKCDCGTLFSRKDSYNTHRAFCDSLVDGSSRFNSNSKANQTFRQDLINGSFSVSTNPRQEQVISPFSHVLLQQNHVFPGEPADSILANSHLLRSVGQKPKLPVWLDCSNYNSTHFGYPTVNSQMGLQELVQSNAVMNMFGLSNPSAQPQNQYVSSVSQPPLKWGPKEEEEEEEDRENVSQTMTSLYSNNQNNNQQISAHMSATALLQRAAQMGSTRPNPALNNAIFGSMTSSASPLSQVTAPISDPVDKFLNGQGDHGFMSQMSSSSASGSSLGDGLLLGDLNYSKPVLISGSNFDHLMMINGSLNQSGKLKMGGKNESKQMSLTRDFLGVGTDLSNELLKFDDHGHYLNQYSGGG